MPDEVVRLRPSIIIAEKEEAIAFSSWNATVHLRGSNSVALWHAIRPSLAGGISEEALVEALPEGNVRHVVADLLSDLGTNNLLEVVDEKAAGTRLSEDIKRWIGSKTVRAAAVTRRLSVMALTVSGTDAHLLRLVQARLEDAGLSASLELRPDSRVDAEIHIDSGTLSGSVVVIQTLGTTLVGPVPAGPSITAMLLLADRHRSDGVRLTGLDDVTTELAASQALLAILSTAVTAEEAAHSSSAPPASSSVADTPQVYVTDAFAVSELHPLTIAWPHSLISAIGSVSVMQGDQLSSSETHGETPPAAEMESLKALWDRHGGAVSEPHPRDLPQIPYALATCRDLDTDYVALGIGSQLDVARWDALRHALRASIPPEWSVRLGLGRSGAEARDDAILQWISSPSARVRWDASTEITTDRSPAARRAWSTATLRLGATVGVHAELTRVGSLSLHRVRATTGVHRVDVYSQDQDQALTGALVRLGGLLQANATAGQGPGQGGSGGQGSAAPAISVGPGLSDWAKAMGLRVRDVDSGQAALHAAVVES
ncbi:MULTISPECIES: hypothetical protein [Clavibacter]|uniref:Uncharacterized protein n=2 Tax=Clavibacter TaxID=1573 RepID=A0A399NZE3_9MICO|nr:MULTISPECIES: hypothetical protein [Clavibacter]KDP89814.1 hypothetical protein W824_15075 [Clavibacter cf. michiganensis LMG 26808]RII99088.1 hypothetical protein DZF96_00150 [Clavibacter michiganensis]UKF26707.1 hypothetical protein KYT88_15630 [Clavibacter sp. A6099]